MRMVILLALALVACSDDDSGDGVLTAHELPAAYRSAACSYLVRCGMFPDSTSCQSANLPVIVDGFRLDLDPNLVAAIDAGRVQLDTAQAQLCLAAIGALSCDRTSGDLDMVFQRCLHVLHGTLAGGASCFLDEECISNQCSGSSTTDACVAGTCVGDTPPATMPAELGMPCTFETGCVEGAFCDYNETGTCVARRNQGESCSSTRECAAGLGCVGDLPPFTCQPLPGLGEPCPYLICRDVGTYCSASGTCERVGLEGAACSGVVGECAPDYPCDTSTGTCTRAPGVDEPCGYTTAIRCFDAGLVCDEAVSTCIAPKEDGEPCTVDAVCKSGHCDVLAGACAPAVLCQ